MKEGHDKLKQHLVHFTPILTFQHITQLMKGPNLPIHNSQCILLLPVVYFNLFQQLLTVSASDINAVHLQHMTLGKWGVGKRFPGGGKGAALRTGVLVNVN